MEKVPPGIDFEETKRILAALEREDVRYVLIGAMAMAAQGASALVPHLNRNHSRVSTAFRFSRR